MSFDNSNIFTTPAQQRAFNLYITATVKIANTNFGLGQLFPKTA